MLITSFSKPGYRVIILEDIDSKLHKTYEGEKQSLTHLTLVVIGFWMKSRVRLIKQAAKKVWNWMKDFWEEL